jgi:hypothetical protein
LKVDIKEKDGRKACPNPRIARGGEGEAGKFGMLLTGWWMGVFEGL